MTGESDGRSRAAWARVVTTGEDVEHIYDQRDLALILREDSGIGAMSGDARPRQARSGRMHHKTRFNPCERLRCTPSCPCDWRPLLTEQPPGTCLDTPTHTTVCCCEECGQDPEGLSYDDESEAPGRGLEWPMRAGCLGDCSVICLVPKHLSQVGAGSAVLPRSCEERATDLRRTTLQG